MESLDFSDDVDAQFTTIAVRLGLTSERATRGQVVDEFFALCDAVLDRRPGLATQVFQQVAFLHAERHADAQVWMHVERWARSRDARIRGGLEFGFLRVIPERPVVLEDVERLWRLGTVPETRWAIWAAYRGEPKQYVIHRERLSRWLGRRGIDVSAVAAMIRS